MFYEPRNANHGLPRDPFKSCIVPRPIGWISSRSSEGVVNLAPYSFFNALSSEPPMVMFSSNGHKDSWRNCEATGEFVVNIATWELRERQPGMMTLISLAITVAFVYSIATLFVNLGAGFFWELVTLIDVMLLGHWLEMRSVRQASGALDELAIDIAWGWFLVTGKARSRRVKGPDRQQLHGPIALFVPEA